MQSVDLPGGPVVKTSCFHCGRHGFSLVGELRFPHATHGMAKRKKKKKVAIKSVEPMVKFFRLLMIAEFTGRS